MENDLVDTILKVCKILNNHSVQYLAVGGAAVALHGYYRHSVNLLGEVTNTPDLDFWYNPTHRNYSKLLNALEEIGQDVKEFREEQFPNPKKSFFKLKFDDFTADFLPSLKAPLNFKSSFDNKEVVTLDEVDIPFISFADLILDKQATSRPKDIEDIKQLKLKRKLKGK